MFFDFCIGVIYKDKEWKDKIYEEIKNRVKNANFSKDRIDIGGIITIKFIKFDFNSDVNIDKLRGYKFDTIFGQQDCFTSTEERVIIKTRLNPVRLKIID